MKMHHLWHAFLVLVLLSTVSGSSLAQLTFERTYGGTEHDRGYSVRQTLDGGYVFAGTTQSFGAGGSDLLVIRTDSLGDTVWIRVYGGPQAEEGRSIQLIGDEGFVVAGYTQSSGAGRWDVFLVRTDPYGDTLWTRTYGESLSDYGYSIESVSDGGLMVCGLSTSFRDPWGDVYLVRTDSLGSPLWEKTYNGGGTDEGYSVEETFDGGYVVAGLSNSFPASWYDVYLLRTDSSGSVLWSKFYGGWANDYGRSVRETKDRGYVITGTTESTTPSNAYLIKTDTLGDVVWERTYGDTSPADGYCGVETSDGGYAITGSSVFFMVSRGEVFLIKTDSLGNVLWTRTYGGVIAQRGYCLEQTSDGGFIIVGITSSFGSGKDDVYVIKTDAEGLVARDVSVVELVEPADTVYTDSICHVGATITNLLPGWPWVEVIATIDGYCDTSRIIALPRDSMHHVDFQDWPVPAAESTTYTMTVCTITPGDTDSTNDCMQKTVFALDPIGAQEERDRPVARELRLWENSPSPFDHSTLISYSLSQTSQVTLAIYDIAGRMVETLVKETQQPGIHQVHWSRKTNPNGVYFYRLKAGEFVETRKMVVE